MSKALRWSEKWFHRGLWLVALVFAWFLIGLGSAVVGDLPRVEAPLRLDDFLDQAQVQPLRQRIEQAKEAGRAAQDAQDQARLAWERARSSTQAERETFANWLALRSSTQRAETDPEVMARTRALDGLKAREQQARQALQEQQQALLDARQSEAAARGQLNVLEHQGRELLQVQERRVQLRVFAMRLALTLPLLVLAGWLFARKRRSTWWPFVWGFILFALFTFFFELVPYLPSYGGYVRYGVGLVLTLVIGRYAIVALQRYLERQRSAERLPDGERRRQLPYDVAQARLAKGVCPGCERSVDLKDGVTDFCPHCGIGLFDHCGHCQTRKSTFAHFCQHCGSAAAPAAGAAPHAGA
ncbi:zinc ribbon domain-containing protein [Comamonas faecalis]|uniref:Zinc ribbon domain-containing protein n=1 Tax=Comamonas faecalis TaxID=1387849 RepID=A0ABP7RLE0_9BURK